VASQTTEGYSVTTDSSGNVFVAGDTSGGLDGNTLTGYADFFVTKYDSSGTKKWTKQLGAASTTVHASGVASDSSGNVYVAGSTSGGLDGNSLSGTGNTDLFFTKYNSSGTKQWTRQLGPTGTNNFANGMGVAVDSSGNIYVAGYTNASIDGQTKTGLYDLFIVKYDPTGTKLWTHLLGAVSALTYTNGVTTDASGNVFVTGYTTGGMDGNTKTGNQDIFVTKYDTSGNKQWTRQMGVAAKNTIGQSVTTDTFGNVFIAGYTKGNLDGNAKIGIQDIFLSKYTATGVLQWTKQLGVAAATIFSYGAAIDSSGRLYVSGTSNGGLDGNTLIGSVDFFVSQYIGN
jgi:outer membrane protein assembly factor BamB